MSKGVRLSWWFCCGAKEIACWGCLCRTPELKAGLSVIVAMGNVLAALIAIYEQHWQTVLPWIIACSFDDFLNRTGRLMPCSSGRIAVVDYEMKLSKNIISSKAHAF